MSREQSTLAGVVARWWWCESSHREGAWQYRRHTYSARRSRRVASNGELRGAPFHGASPSDGLQPNTRRRVLAFLSAPPCSKTAQPLLLMLTRVLIVTINHPLTGTQTSASRFHPRRIMPMKDSCRVTELLRPSARSRPQRHLRCSVTRPPPGRVTPSYSRIHWSYDNQPPHLHRQPKRTAESRRASGERIQRV